MQITGHETRFYMSNEEISVSAPKKRKKNKTRASKHHTLNSRAPRLWIPSVVFSNANTEKKKQQQQKKIHRDNTDLLHHFKSCRTKSCRRPANLSESLREQKICVSGSPTWGNNGLHRPNNARGHMASHM